MQYRRFGRTNLMLSVFSLGTMRYLESQANAIATIRAAIDRGINHIETARGYGQSEAFLGAALADEIDRDRVYITTKIPPTPDAATMTQAIEDSLRRLNTDYIDNLAIHGLNTAEHLGWVTSPDGCMAALTDAVKAGKIRHLGFSSHGSRETIAAAMQIEAFSFVNLHYYLFFQRHAPLLDLARSRDLGLLIISPADKGGQLHTPPQTLIDRCAPLSPLGLNYRFLLSDRRITTLSLGAANPDELATPLSWSDATEPLTADEREILARLDRAERDALGADHCAQCYACLPCPEAIQIPEVLRLRNLAIGHEMTSFGQYRYRMFENAGHWFPGRRGHRCTDCGDCLPRCPERLDIPRLLRDTHDRLNTDRRRRLWGDDDPGRS
jgi:predicted aldo/keto reductase-like oxidoreductase